MTRNTAQALLGDHVDLLMHRLPLIRDGVAEAMHDARIGTRRIREALPLLTCRSDEAMAELRRAFQKVGRALGEVRDRDVTLTLLEGLQRRHPRAAAATGPVHHALATERLRAQRWLIKLMESLAFDRVVQRLPRTLRTGWNTLLRERVRERADALRRGVEHAGGVYFPNRVHAVRIEAKKLRYSLELASAARIWNGPDGIRTLKKIQDALGRAHDRQMLIDRLQAVGGSQAESAAWDVLVEMLEGEALDFHRQYLDRRPEVGQAAESAHRAMSARWYAAGGGRAALAVALGALAGSSTVWFARPRSGRAAVAAEEAGSHRDLDPEAPDRLRPSLVRATGRTGTDLTTM
jgi:CHAD domain-containing protein